jgi:hypothetical protein
MPEPKGVEPGCHCWCHHVAGFKHNAVEDKRCSHARYAHPAWPEIDHLKATIASLTAEAATLKREAAEWEELADERSELYEIWRRKGNEQGGLIKELEAEVERLRGLREAVALVLLDALNVDCPLCLLDGGYHTDGCAFEILRIAWDAAQPQEDHDYEPGGE